MPGGTEYQSRTEQAREIQTHVAPLSMLRDLSKDIPLMTEKKYSVWTAHMLSYMQAAGDWGDADVPEVCTNTSHQKGITAKGFMSSNVAMYENSRFL